MQKRPRYKVKIIKSPRKLQDRETMGHEVLEVKLHVEVEERSGIVGDILITDSIHYDNSICITKYEARWLRDTLNNLNLE